MEPSRFVSVATMDVGQPWKHRGTCVGESEAADAACGCAGRNGDPVAAHDGEVMPATDFSHHAVLIAIAKTGLFEMPMWARGSRASAVAARDRHV